MATPRAQSAAAVSKRKCGPKRAKQCDRESRRCITSRSPRMKPAKREWFAVGRWISSSIFGKLITHDWLIHRHLQIPTSTSGEQALPRDRDSDDHDRLAAVLFQVALGACAVCCRL